jgi:hypothetical protein
LRILLEKEEDLLLQNAHIQENDLLYNKTGSTSNGNSHTGGRLPWQKNRYGVTRESDACPKGEKQNGGVCTCGEDRRWTGGCGCEATTTFCRLKDLYPYAREKKNGKFVDVEVKGNSLLKVKNPGNYRDTKRSLPKGGTIIYGCDKQ